MGAHFRAVAPLIAVPLLAVVLAGCGGQPAATTPTTATTTTTKTTAATVTGSSDGVACGSTPIHTGDLPGWAADAGAPGLPYVMAHEGNLIGVLFVQPLAAPARTTGPNTAGPNNKVLWISRVPREGAELRLTLTPAAGPAVTLAAPAGSSPGEIYPSIVDVTGPGCWSVMAEWGNNRATLELSFVAS